MKKLLILIFILILWFLWNFSFWLEYSSVLVKKLSTIETMFKNQFEQKIVSIEDKQQNELYSKRFEKIDSSLKNELNSINSDNFKLIIRNIITDIFSLNDLIKEVSYSIENNVNPYELTQDEIEQVESKLLKIQKAFFWEFFKWVEILNEIIQKWWFKEIWTWNIEFSSQDLEISLKLNDSIKTINFEDFYQENFIDLDFNLNLLSEEFQANSQWINKISWNIVLELKLIDSDMYLKLKKFTLDWDIKKSPMYSQIMLSINMFKWVYFKIPLVPEWSQIDFSFNDMQKLNFLLIKWIIESNNILMNYSLFEPYKKIDWNYYLMLKKDTVLKILENFEEFYNLNWSLRKYIENTHKNNLYYWTWLELNSDDENDDDLWEKNFNSFLQELENETKGELIEDAEKWFISLIMTKHNWIDVISLFWKSWEWQTSLYIWEQNDLLYIDFKFKWILNNFIKYINLSLKDKNLILNFEYWDNDYKIIADWKKENWNVDIKIKWVPWENNINQLKEFELLIKWKETKDEANLKIDLNWKNIWVLYVFFSKDLMNFNLLIDNDLIYKFKLLIESNVKFEFWNFQIETPTDSMEFWNIQNMWNFNQNF